MSNVSRHVTSLKSKMNNKTRRKRVSKRENAKATNVVVDDDGVVLDAHEENVVLGQIITKLRTLLAEKEKEVKCAREEVKSVSAYCEQLKIALLDMDSELKEVNRTKQRLRATTDETVDSMVEKWRREIERMQHQHATREKQWQERVRTLESQLEGLKITPTHSPSEVLNTLTSLQVENSKLKRLNTLLRQQVKQVQQTTKSYHEQAWKTVELQKENNELRRNARVNDASFTLSNTDDQDSNRVLDHLSDDSGSKGGSSSMKLDSMVITDLRRQLDIAHANEDRFRRQYLKLLEVHTRAFESTPGS